MRTLTQTTADKRITEVDRDLGISGLPAVCNPEQAREAMGLECARTVCRLVARGELRAMRIGNRLRIRRAEIARFIVEREGLA